MKIDLLLTEVLTAVTKRSVPAMIVFETVALLVTVIAVTEVLPLMLVLPVIVIVSLLT